MKKSYVAQNGSTWIVPHKKLSLDKKMFISISIQADYAIILQLLMPYNWSMLTEMASPALQGCSE